MEAATNSKACLFFSVLLAAVSEWCLIIVLLLNAVLAYVATQIARLCRLPPPCLLCSRLDHVFGNESRGFYRSLFCHAHKVEVSSLIYCHSHRKLADFREMCEGCLLSSAATATATTSATKKHKFALTANPDAAVKVNGEETDRIPPVTGDPGSLPCSCCSEPFNLRRLLQARKMLTKRVDGAIPHRRLQLKKKGLNLATAPHAHDLHSHVTYSELKVTSESESEMPFSGDDGDDDDDGDADDGYSPVQGVKDIKEESVTRGRGLAVEDLVPERLIHPNPVVVAPERSILDHETKAPVKERDSWEKSSVVSEAAVACGVEETNWSSADAKANPEETSERTIEQDAGDRVQTPTNLEPGKQSSTTGFSSQAIAELVQAARTSPADRNDSFKNALVKKGIMLSPRFSEIVSGKAQEDFKLRLSQKSYRLLDLPWNSEMACSPRLQPQSEDASSSIGLQNIAKRLSVERNNSNLESCDANLIADFEGENNVDLLKQQIELDRKTMGALYKELDEERNASAVAANEAMAMINRLQEEKAAMQMEALQCLRMMEEQAEYDQEAIQKLNDLLTDREKELLDLEAELESCRKRLGEEVEEGLAESREAGSTNSTPRHVESLGRSKSEKSNLVPLEYCTDYGSKDLLMAFEQEKAQISTCLHRLQDKFASQGGPSSMENDELASVQDEVSKLNERLNAIDADREFLAHAISALRYGGDGVRLVQEIACQLKELRRVPVA